MYLIALNSYDYIWVTVFFSLFCLIAYFYRRKNSTSQEFMNSNTKLEFIAWSGFGLIEIIVAGMLGSYYGFNAIYAVILVILIVFAGQKLLSRSFSEFGVNNFADYIREKYGVVSGLVIAILLVILFTLCISLAMCLVFKSVHSLMGWNFGNSVFGLFAVTIIALIVGARSGVTANKLLNYAVIIVTFISVIITAIYKLDGLGAMVTNLNHLALAQKLDINYYIHIPYQRSILIPLVSLMIGLGGFYLLRFNLSANKGLGQPTKTSLLVRICVVIILIMPGIIAIATPTNGGIPGKNIVTIEAQLPDGQMGYIVKAIDKQGQEKDPTPGLIPPLLNAETSLVEKGQYDYLVSNIVTFRHYLPKPFMIMILLTLLAGFMVAIADYLLDLSQIALKNILVPLRLIKKYGEIGELWALRLNILFFSAISLTVAHFIVPHFNLLWFIMLLGSLLVAPLIAILILSITNINISYIPLALSVGIISAVIFLFSANSHETLDKFIFSGIIAFIISGITAIVLGFLRRWIK